MDQGSSDLGSFDGLAVAIHIGDNAIRDSGEGCDLFREAFQRSFIFFLFQYFLVLLGLEMLIKPACQRCVWEMLFDCDLLFEQHAFLLESDAPAPATALTVNSRELDHQ